MKKLLIALVSIVPLLFPITGILNAQDSVYKNGSYHVQGDAENRTISSIAQVQSASLTTDSIVWSPATLFQSQADSPQIAISPSNKIFISWRNGCVNECAVYVRRSEDGGESFGDAVFATNKAYDRHTLIADNAENVYVAGLFDAVYLNRSTDSGGSFGSAVRIDDGTGVIIDGTNPDLAEDGSGTIYAVWSHRTTNRQGIFFAKSTNRGSSFGPTIPVYAVPDSPDYFYFSSNPSIAVGSNGTIYVVWADSQETGVKNVYFSRSTDGGNSFESKRRINDVLANQGLDGVEEPQIAVFGNEQVYAVWSDFRNGSYNVYFARSIDGGISFQPNQRIYDGSGFQRYPSIAVGPSGQILMSWFDTRNTTGPDGQIYPYGDIYTSISTDGGITFGPNTRANSYIGSVSASYGLSSAVFDANGRPHIVWQESFRIYYSVGSIGSGPTYSISGQITDANNTPVSDITISDGAGHTTTTDSNGNYTLSGLSAGIYTLTPFKASYTFFPQSSSSITVPPDVIGVDFTTTQILSSMPDFKQFSQPWGDDAYDHIASTVSGSGCYITSVIDILRYWGITTNVDGQDVNPQTLNNYLSGVGAGGYNQSGGVIWAGIEKYVSGHISWEVLKPASGQTRSQAIDAQIAKNQPVMVSVPYPDTKKPDGSYKYPGGHWVVIIGNKVNDHYPIRDPGGYQATDLGSYGDEDAIRTMILWKPANSYSSQLRIAAHSPVELLVTDPLGRRTGYDPLTQTTINEIPGADYLIEYPIVDQVTIQPIGEPEKVLYIPLPQVGQYDLTVTGVGTGAYTLDFQTLDNLGTFSTQSINGFTTQDTVTHYPYQYDSQDITLPNQTPVINAGGPYSGVVGETITFDSSGSFDPDGTLVLYEWDFESDGIFDVSSSQPTAMHAYPEAFSGMVTLRATDNDGKAGTGTADIQIEDVTANLTVVKTVVNDHSGTKTVSDFSLFVNGNPVTSSVATTVAPGTNTVSEQNLPGYTATFSGDCNASGQVTVNVGESKICIITNDDQPGSITIVKDAIPDDPQDFAFSGTLGNFMLDDDPGNTTLSNQTTFANLASGSYTVNETAVNDWNVTTIACNDSDSIGNPAARSATVNLQLGESVTCTFTNQRQVGTVVGTCGGYTVYQNGSVYSAPGWNGTIKVGTSANNTINGSSGADLILGLGGNDKLYGKGGDDVVCGGDGNDLIEGAAGNDSLEGGNGNDLLRGQSGDYDILLSGNGNDGLFDPDGVDGIHGGAGIDLLTFALRKGWRDRTGVSRFDHKLSGGYQDDVVLFTILDRSTFFIDITGDERDNPPAVAEGRNDSLALAAKLDPASVILKFEHSLVKAADADAVDQVTTMEQQYASEYGFVLDESGEEDAEQDMTQDNRLFLPIVMQ